MSTLATPAPTAAVIAKNDKIEKALRVANTICENHSVRLTLLRKQILTLILQHGKPLGAYALMDLLEQNSEREKVAPPTVYRTLDFLIKYRLIHKIHSLNAYLANTNPLREDSSVLLICATCGLAQEVPNNTIQQAINLSASQHRFAVKKQVIELSGVCYPCKTNPMTPISPPAGSHLRLR